MKNISSLWLGLVAVVSATSSQAIDLKQSKLSQVVNDVQIIAASGQGPRAAGVNDVFSMPDILRTGADSRAELVAQDETVTRVGANTIFSFDPANRTINLKQGSLLFHSPHGKGGGTIHTGSATASVLGTTLIVSTMPDGGMKVLDLEGRVNVNLKNKKKQKLSGGQMTFILPGADQLAPIVVFRLDELVRNSLLVRGFGHPLASLPLVNGQIGQQLKLIKSGRATDTGLLVGNSATSDQVEVIDPGTIQNGVFNSSLKKALQTDANLRSSSLTDAGIPTPPARIFLNHPFSLGGNPFFASRSFSGFAGRNLGFNSATIDVAPYAAHPRFDFVAAANLRLNTSVTFVGLSALNQLSLVGGQQLIVAPGITVQADVGDFELVTPGALSMTGGGILNALGKVGLTSGSTINLQDFFILPAGPVTLTAPTAINLSWTTSGYVGLLGATDDDGNLATDPDNDGDPYFGILNSTDNKIITDAKKGRVTLTSQTGSLTINSTSIQAHYLTLNSGDSILLDASGQTLTAAGTGATASFTAPNVITVTTANLSDFGVVNMAANTINLSDVSFGAGSAVTLKSLLGSLNLGSSLPGYVNFIQNVTYGGNPAQNYVNNGGGITVTTLH